MFHGSDIPNKIFFFLRLDSDDFRAYSCQIAGRVPTASEASSERFEPKISSSFTPLTAPLTTHTVNEP